MKHGAATVAISPLTSLFDPNSQKQYARRTNTAVSAYSTQAPSLDQVLASAQHSLHLGPRTILSLQGQLELLLDQATKN